MRRIRIQIKQEGGTYIAKNNELVSEGKNEAEALGNWMLEHLPILGGCSYNSDEKKVVALLVGS